MVGESVPYLQIILHFSLVFIFLSLGGERVIETSMMGMIALDGTSIQVLGVGLVVRLSSFVDLAAMQAAGAATRYLIFPFSFRDL